ncbi:MAG TPA: glycosyltransferase [Longimicrobium sp.]|nr:glycosyltransferase [Longimicrobium sp.]
MKVGITFYPGNPLSPVQVESLKHVQKSMTDAITARHELVLMPAAYNYASGDDLQRLVREFVESCDVIVGSPMGLFPAVRQQIGSRVPLVGYLLGTLQRGGWGLDVHVPNLNTNDVFVANCTADLELAHKYFDNAQARLLPFAVDDRVFYPVDEAERKAIREKLGFGEQDRILVYAGRLMLQKNIHTLLKVFSAVQRVVPDACLVIAGPAGDVGSPEFGIVSLDLAATVVKLVSRLGIPEGRVQILSQAAPDRVRELYQIADVKVNLTLHHDENFGLAQVEAMACGTPVVGTAWAGLRDTIVDGVSGYRVSTLSTPSGVKANWWEAVNRIVELLQDPAARERFRDSCVRHATEQYSQSRYEATLLEILSASVEARERPAQPLQPTPFARELWSTCRPRAPQYLRGSRCFELYQELVAPLTALSGEHALTGEALEPRQVLSLATPIMADGDGRFRMDDPMYPFDIDVPEALAAGFEAILSVLREEPAITAERMCRAVAGVPDASAALAWMLARGLLLRTQPVDGWIAPEMIDRRLSEPLFRVERLDGANIDFLMLMY